MNPKDISIEDFSYFLPDQLIASHPLAQRDACRLLVDKGGDIIDAVFSDLPDLLPKKAVIVTNNTRVINARLRMRKPGGAHIEIFCLEPETPADYESNFGACGSCAWKCLVGNSKRWKEGPLTQTYASSDGTEVTLTATRDRASDIVDFCWSPARLSFSEVLAAAGEIPIPPYLNRPSENSDTTDYQTVYSHIEGSVAAPTAGLHFTPQLLDRLDKASFKRLELTLHVGAGTFKPVKSATIGGHDMHSEFIEVSRHTIEALATAIAEERPIIAVGTTSVRTLESLYHIGRAIMAGTWKGRLGQWEAYGDTGDTGAATALQAVLRHLDETGDDTLTAYTRIIIAPGYTYRIVSGMVTNFHQPQSTLLLLVSAFLGGERWRQVYSHAIAVGYRFLSYGDACLFLH